MIKACITTLGCPKNLVDSEKLLGDLSTHDIAITENILEANVVFVNTCSFIEKAKEESIDTILEIVDFKQKNQLDFKLVVIGCMVKHYHTDLKTALPEVDLLVDFKDYTAIKDIIHNLVDKQKKRTLKKDTALSYNDLIPRYQLTPKHYAYLKIAEGCSNACSFCVIPKLRGKYKSRSMDSILKEVKLLSKNGVKELIIIAQDTTYYGQDLYQKLSLPKLLRKIARIEGIEWIRIMYAYPNYISDELIELIATEDKICKYLDIPLQHISDPILKQMRRRITKKEILALLKKLRDKISNLYLRTAFIVGFPGETDKDYKELLNFITKTEFERLGAFTYSKEEKTLAGVMSNQVSETLKIKRLDTLLKIQKKIADKKNNNMLEKEIEVIIDEKIPDKKNLYLGRGRGDAPEIDQNILIKGKNIAIGSIIKVKVIETLKQTLIGKQL